MDRLVRATALLLTVLTGFSGLVYEVTWQKYLATLLGSHSEATAAVLALFLGGLSVGYALFGARHAARRRSAPQARGEAPRLLLLYGAVEAGIGVYALLFPWLFRAVHALSLAIPHEAGGVGFALDVALSALLVLPPAVLMGGTIPILTQALSRSLDDATRLHAQVYAFNTAGAFVGALAAAFVLIPLARARRRRARDGRREPRSRARPSSRSAGGASRAAPALPAADARARRASALGLLRRRRAAGRLRDDGAPDRADPHRRALVRLLALHLLDGRRGVRALHRARLASPSRRCRASRRGLIAATQWMLAARCWRCSTRRQRARPTGRTSCASWFRDIDAAFYPYHVDGLRLPAGGARRADRRSRAPRCR